MVYIQTHTYVCMYIHPSIHPSIHPYRQTDKIIDSNTTCCKLLPDILRLLLLTGSKFSDFAKLIISECHHVIKGQGFIQDQRAGFHTGSKGRVSYRIKGQGFILDFFERGRNSWLTYLASTFGRPEMSCIQTS